MHRMKPLKYSMTSQLKRIISVTHGLR